MTVAWPSTLPQCFLADSISLEQAQNVISSEMSVGPDKVRRRSTAAVRPMTGTLKLDAAQYEIFTAFVETDIADGARPFLFPRQEPPLGTSILVRLKPPYKVSRVGNHWRVTLDLQVLP